jgi:hypothetical protein
MRIIDIAIPKSEPDTDAKPIRPAMPNTQKIAFRSQHTIEEYVLDDDDESTIDGSHNGNVVESTEPDKFYDAPDDTTEVRNQLFIRPSDRILTQFNRRLSVKTCIKNLSSSNSRSASCKPLSLEVLLRALKRLWRLHDLWDSIWISPCASST